MEDSKIAFDVSIFEDTDIEGFEPSEVHDMITNYVCAHCYSQLTAFNIPNDRLFIIICSECGENVEKLGAISRNTVSIRYEQERREFRTVVRNLKDLYSTIQHMVEIKHTPLREGETEEDRNIREFGF